MKISMIVAADEQNGIGKNNQLLCHLPADLKYFKNLTTGHAILMGRKTFDSIGKPLPNRVNIVISRNVKAIDGCVVFDTVTAGIDYAKSLNETELFIIGGDSIFKQSLEQTDVVYLTRIHHTFEADTFFPALGNSWKLLEETACKADEKNKFDYTFKTFGKTN
ncbi:MAG: dihydrofolate reductase [Bacteroidota bacterium]